MNPKTLQYLMGHSDISVTMNVYTHIKRNKKTLDGVRAATFKPLIECLKSIDQELLKGAVAGAKFSELFFASCKDEELAAYVKTLL